MLIAALVTGARIWKQPACPPKSLITLPSLEGPALLSQFHLSLLNYISSMLWTMRKCSVKTKLIFKNYVPVGGQQ